MPIHQRFRLGSIVKSLAVQYDANGQLYSDLTDIQDLFSDVTTALRLKVDGVNLSFLKDEQGKRYEPKRIAHYPDDIIDIVPCVPTNAPLDPPLGLGEKTMHHSGLSTQRRPTQSPSISNIEHTVSTLSLQSCSSDLGRLPASTNAMTASKFLLASLVSTLVSNASGILHLQQQVTQLDNTGSVQHLQLMERIAQMIQHQNELLKSQNDLLHEQANAKARDEKVLAELEAVKLRDLEMHRLQKQTVDRLIVAQQRIDALLVQNYELHEYPIPRLFVILPDSYESWDPRSFLKERFRLFFLCECSEDCGQGTSQGTTSGQLAITAADALVAPIRARNRIHLAKHEGYELSRPTEFFERYGLYVLGMLRILKHCLAVATVAAPVVALVDNSIKDVMDGVKSISESTMKAVDMSINFLEQELDEGSVSDALAGTRSDGKDADDIFKSLAALEGADLRRLDTFLRNNDRDKILGNLYRTTTEEGHVKWVCFEHYQEKYRASSLASFVQSVEVTGGSYDPHFRSVTIDLSSATAAKDFFKRLTTQATAVDNLDVTLSWDFGSADLVNLVDMVAKSNIKSITLDLQDDPTSNSALAAFRPGKGRYHSLLGLLANKNLRRLQLSNLRQLGTRTSNLPSSVVAPWMQGFHFHGQVNDEGRDRLTNILSLCPNLVDLRLSGSLSERNEMDLGLHLQIFASKKLQRLHVMGWYRHWREIPEEYTWWEGMPLRELVCNVGALHNSCVERCIWRSRIVLEVLVLSDDYFNATPIDLSPKTGGFSDGLSFSRLTHLNLHVKLADESLEFLSSTLPRLNLVHFGCDRTTESLLRHVNLASLKSLSLDKILPDNFSLLRKAIQGLGGECQIEFLNVSVANQVYEDLSDILGMLRLKRLYLSHVYARAMISLFKHLNLSNLQTVSVFESNYSSEAGAVLAQRRKEECAVHFVVQLDPCSWSMYTTPDGDGNAVRTWTGRALPVSSFEYQVQNKEGKRNRNFQFLQTILPEYSY
ncbi:hypothetical protein K457DRAFT_140018 [Linnemannia elongata AG-77]|uniref:Uncharacterized protein n=1 Tax=Linnemannia elongata AG-77 TaxID=1314771 RepID=A0A197JQZ1_9FUNG|nr:hypothetical protein K457DRAFT_140018 [Linnemannia elongata AG-77]